MTRMRHANFLKVFAANGNQSDNLLIECDEPEYDIEVQIA
jgi:hypothetical protein